MPRRCVDRSGDYCGHDAPAGWAHKASIPVGVLFHRKQGTATALTRVDTRTATLGREDPAQHEEALWSRHLLPSTVPCRAVCRVNNSLTARNGEELFSRTLACAGTGRQTYCRVSRETRQTKCEYINVTECGICRHARHSLIQGNGVGHASHAACGTVACDSLSAASASSAANSWSSRVLV